MSIFLKSNPLVVSKILKKTSAVFFKDLKVGDHIRLSVAVKASGSNGGSIYATYIKATNLTTGTSVHKSFTEISSCLEKFELTEMPKVLFCKEEV